MPSRKLELPLDEKPGELKRELQDQLAKVGPDQYAATTAREFAAGGAYNPKSRKARYAITD